MLFSFCKDGITRYTKQPFLCVWNITTKTKMYSIFLGFLYLGSAVFVNDVLLLNYYQTSCNQQLIVEFQLLDYTNGNVITSIPEQNIFEIMSNGRFLIACRENELSLWCLKKKDFIYDLFISLDWDEVHDTNFVITKTKISYAKKISFNAVILYIRDYEIPNSKYI